MLRKMINRTCDICGEYTNDVWVVVLDDDKNKFEISGCKRHIDELQKKIKLVKDIHKKSVDKILKEIGFVKR
jgi:hypothetical protein